MDITADIATELLIEVLVELTSGTELKLDYNSGDP